ncbi:MAG: hypothetical protein H8D78_12780 [Chloroflexi bacterium]|nr:hypothetical protein [Chloroflexota bacterium]
MESRITVMPLRATYNRDLDTLYLSSPECTGRWMDSWDGIFFFTKYNHREDEIPRGFEIHFFSEVWNDREVIPPLTEMRFDVIGTSLREVSLDEVLRWAYQRYVAARRPREEREPRTARPVLERALAEGRVEYTSAENG